MEFIAKIINGKKPKSNLEKKPLYWRKFTKQWSIQFNFPNYLLLRPSSDWSNVVGEFSLSFAIPSTIFELKKTKSKNIVECNNKI